MRGKGIFTPRAMRFPPRAGQALEHVRLRSSPSFKPFRSNQTSSAEISESIDRNTTASASDPCEFNHVGIRIPSNYVEHLQNLFSMSFPGKKKWYEGQDNCNNSLTLIKSQFGLLVYVLLGMFDYKNVIKSLIGLIYSLIRVARA